MHCSAFTKLNTGCGCEVYPYDDNLPKFIINPALNYLPSPQITLSSNINYCINACNSQNVLYDSPKSIATPNNKFNISKEVVKPKSITSVKDGIENTSEFEKAIRKYQLLEKSKVLCLRCQNNVNMIDCFNYRDCAYICIKCASEAFNSITQLKDWEKRCKDVESGCYRCDRLKHCKELYSYIRYSLKKNGYEICSLCLYCRNVKKCEYLMSKRNKRRIYNKLKIFY